MNDLPKLLVISTNAWKDNSGINTLIQLIKVWDKNKLAQIYTKSALPNTRICDVFFQISENAVFKSIFQKRIQTGKRVINEFVSEESTVKVQKEENKFYQRLKMKHLKLLYMCRELVWLLGNWKTKELECFVDDYDADVLFLPIYPTIYMGRIQYYILKRTKKPAVCYLADDNYTYKSIGFNPISYLHRFFLRHIVKKVVGNCKKMFVIAPKQKEEYDRIFGVDSILLTKGIDFSEVEYVQKQIHTPIKMVYTGKLIIGRWKSLATIASALEDINKEHLKITLEIYTNDNIESTIRKQLNRNGCIVKGEVSFNEVAKIQENADIVVFVESLNWRYKNAARLSFSTKLTDYLKSGRCIFAIGDKEIAPIDYLMKNDSAIIATSYHEIKEALKKLVEDTSIIQAYSKKAYECGLKNHNQLDIERKLISTISEVYKYGE